jgi:hypothetical protein
MPEELGGKNFMQIIDNVILWAVAGLGWFAIFMGASVLKNVREGTSTPGKLKERGPQKRQILPWNVVFKRVFGD